jgi:hypothetical protein
VSIPGRASGLPPDVERQLFADVIAHERGAKNNLCRSCGGVYPCLISQEARRRLAAAGIDLNQALGTIWD